MTTERTRVSAGLEVRVSTEVEDALWDRFVDDAPGGHYTQTVAWARFRGGYGWQTVRVTVRDAGDLVAGTQLLLRPIRGVGALAYAQHGPLLGRADPALQDLALRSLLDVCRRHRVRYLMLRPPPGQVVPTARLHELGYRRNHRFTKPSVTARVDLTPPPEAILSRMRRSTRGNVRRGLSRGLTARLGDERDVEALLHLERIAAARKGFAPAQGSRYRALYRALAADARAHVFVVEDAGDPVSAQLAIRAGDTLYSHMMAWSGEDANRKPNELLDWTAMMWARDAGCRYYDFEGINAAPTGDAPATLAVAPADGDQLYVPDYKLGFGAEAAPASLDYDLVINPLLRWGHTELYPKVAQRPVVQKLDKRLQRLVAGRGAS